jgi:hypothetical protein
MQDLQLAVEVAVEVAVEGMADHLYQGMSLKVRQHPPFLLYGLY